MESGTVHPHCDDWTVFLALLHSPERLLAPLVYNSNPHRLRCSLAALETRAHYPWFGGVRESYHWPTKRVCFDPEMETAPDPDSRWWPWTWISDGLREWEM